VTKRVAFSEIQAEALVHEALTILRTLDPTPIRSQIGTTEASRLNLYGKVLYYAKKVATVILVHNPASLEEPVDAPPKKAAPVGGTGLFGKKLRAAVEKLEAAREIGKNEDAMYLLAQMNFVCLLSIGLRENLGLISVTSTEIGHILGTILLPLQDIRSLQTCLETRQPKA
jgi:hypothetical protein